MADNRYLADTFSLDGRALVTGGSSGIGWSIARALALAGAGVVVIARTEAPLVATTQELISSGCRVAHVRGDLGSRDGVRSAADEAAAVFGGPDILLNSVGINLRPPMDSLDDTVWDKTMAVNLEAPYLLGELDAAAPRPDREPSANRRSRDWLAQLTSASSGPGPPA